MLRLFFSHAGAKVPRIILLIVLMALSAAAWADDSLYVQSQNSALLAEPRMDAEQLVRAGRGAELEQLERDGSWYKVRFQGTEGWVSYLTVADQPPMERQSVLGGDAPEIDNPRRRPSQVASAAAARGLTPKQRERLNERQGADYQALRRIEGIELRESELARFKQALRQGKKKPGDG
jgi:hypothetical protein